MSEQNQVSIIEPDTLEYLPAKTILRLIDQSQKAKKWNDLFKVTVKSFPALFRRLEELDIEPSFSLADGDINLTFTGDGSRLSEVWKALREAGYKPDNRPKKGDSTFYTHWRLEDCAIIWLNFSSSVCRRVKVGTKMVEQDVFEVQCGELPEIEGDDKVVVVSGDADELPF